MLIATGIPLASHFSRWESGTLHVKLALVAVVAALTVCHMRRPQMHALEGGIFLGSLAIAWLGVSLAHWRLDGDRFRMGLRARPVGH